MNPFTLLHTVVSVLPVGFGLAAFLRHGAIDPKTFLGKWYIGTMLAGTVSGFGFILTLGFTPGQVLGLFTLALLAIATLTSKGTLRNEGYTQTLALSASYLMLWIFLTTETLKRFPLGQPFATGPNDPSLIPVRLALFTVFLFGAGYQILMIRASHHATMRFERMISNLRHAA